ncbi:MAG TPA: 50S ribosomal protein L6 [bacterium]|nr:50S ribosomal protein L6 [bacterium]
MSRIGKRPVVLPKGVAAKIDAGVLSVRGPKGELKLPVGDELYRAINTEVSEGAVVVTRREESRLGRTQQGLVRALVQNMVVGVTDGYTKMLDVVGVGYKAELKGKVLNLALGFSHPVDFPVPEGITVTVDKQTRIVVTGIDKKLVGETAARIRRFRPPEPYKGKGVRFSDERVRRKVGKAAAGAGSGG